MKPVVTEKAVMLIEAQNGLTFKTDKKEGKEDRRRSRRRSGGGRRASRRS